MNITRLAVYRPVTTLMACLIVVLLGWMALTRLPVDLMPNIVNPSTSVVTIYKGAGPQEIETLITRPIEQSMSSVNGVERIHSVSAEGSSSVRVRFQWGTNLNTAISDMRDALQKIRQHLPEGIEEPYVIHYDVADRPIMYMGLSSDLDPIKLTSLAENHIMPKFEQLEGVARVGLRGEVRREIHVNLDRGKLESLNMGVNEVVTALQRGNVNQPAGDFEQGHHNLLIRSDSEFHSLAEIADTVVRESSGAIVRVRDVAQVVDGEEERTELTRVDGKPAIMLYIFKQSGANTIDVSDQVRERVAEINATMPNVSVTLRMDSSTFIRQSISNIRSSAFYGMGLAVIVLVLFLRSFSSTLVIGISMPLSILATFVLIYFQGFTLNMISFGGLALGIGLLVDNSIVVLESIFRKREAGLAPREAAIEGTGEVASAIVASTLTTLIVFLPLLFTSGVTGILLHQLAWVVSFSLACSLVASLTLTPVLTAYWIDREVFTTTDGKKGPLHLLVDGFHAINRGILNVFETLYERALKFVLKHAGVCAFLLLTAFTTSLGLMPRIGTEFLPKTDEGDLRVAGTMAPGIQLKTLDRQAQQIEQAVFKYVTEAEVTAVFVGDDVDDGEDWNTTRFRIKLKPRSKRKRTIEEIRKDLSTKFDDIAGMKTRVYASNDSMMIRMIRRGSSGGDIDVELRGHDRETAKLLTHKVMEIMETVPGLVNIETEQIESRPELSAAIDRAKASLLNVSVSDIASALETTIRGSEATVYREEGDEFNVLVRLQELDRDRLSDIEQVGVTTPSGKVVALKNLVDFNPSEAPVSIDRLDQQRIFRVSADVEDRDLGSAVADLQTRLNSLPLPESFSMNIAGDWEEQQKSFAELKVGLILAIVLMYMVMASQFESLRDPLLILITIPFGAIGVILILVFTETTLNVQSFIGVVMLAGIVVNNAIVMIDYMKQLRQTQPELAMNDVVIQAAVRRFRPVLMTSCTTVFAMLPIALGWGEGGELQAPMARVVIGGLAVGTVITLFAIPVVYRVCGGKTNPNCPEKETPATS